MITLEVSKATAAFSRGTLPSSRGSRTAEAGHPCAGRRRTWQTLSFVYFFLTPIAFLAQAQSPDDSEEASLPEEVEQAFKEFAKKAAESRLDDFKASLKKQAETLADEVALDPAQKDQLKEICPQVVEETRALWQDRFEASLRLYLREAPDPGRNVESWNPEQLARANYGWARADHTEAWRDALKQVLTPAQRERHEQREGERMAKVRGEIEDYLSSAEDWAKQQMIPTMDVEIAQLRRLAQLEDERVAKLEVAATAALDSLAEPWLRLVEEQLLDMEDEMREQWMTNRSFPSPHRIHNEDASDSEIWKERVSTILTDAERDEVERLRKGLRSRRAEALAMALIEALDLYLGLSAEQREGLVEPVAASFTDLPSYHFDLPPTGGSYRIHLAGLLNHFQGQAVVDQEENEMLSSLLDERQWKRLKSLDQSQLAENHSLSESDDQEALEVPEGEELDALGAQKFLSAYLSLRSRDVSAKWRLMMGAKVEQVTAVTGLDSEQVKRLTTAAKGAAQELAASNVSNLERRARSLVRSVEPAQVPERLKQNPPYLSGRQIDEPELWRRTLLRVLKPEQREAWEWKQEIVAKWQRDTQLAVVLTEIEKVILLTPEQREAFREKLKTLIQVYEEALIRRMGPTWHFQSAYCMVATGPRL